MYNFICLVLLIYLFNGSKQGGRDGYWQKNESSCESRADLTQEELASRCELTKGFCPSWKTTLPSHLFRPCRT